MTLEHNRHAGPVVGPAVGLADMIDKVDKDQLENAWRRCYVSVFFFCLNQHPKVEPHVI